MVERGPVAFWPRLVEGFQLARHAPQVCKRLSRIKRNRYSELLRGYWPTEREYQDLFAASRFKLEQLVYTDKSLTVMEFTLP